MEGIVGLVLFILVVVLYFLPSIIAYKGDKKNKGAILALNIVAGWTFLGWVVAIVWSCME